MISKQEVKKEAKEMLGVVPAWIEEMPAPVLGPFWGLFRDLELGESAIPNKYKDLIGLAVSGATRCRYCTLFHTESARLHGATDDEIAEASAVGGLTMMASTYLNGQQVDYEAFAKETRQIVAYARKQAPKKRSAA